MSFPLFLKIDVEDDAITQKPDKRNSSNHVVKLMSIREMNIFHPKRKVNFFKKLFHFSTLQVNFIQMLP